MDSEAKIWLALLTATVSLIGSGVAILSARWQLHSKIDELTQAQFGEVLAKRIAVYPLLWRIPQTLLSDWAHANKPVNAAWARELLAGLVEWHAEHGVFLSQGSYAAFCALRSEAVELVRKCDSGYEPVVDDLHRLEKTYAQYGLATWLKNDLGSYKSPFLAVAPVKFAPPTG